MLLPKISIITPSYNQGKYIEQTILSVLAQDYPNFEYIIIDGASSDNSVEIIKKYSDKLAYWVSEPDKGFADAIHKGFQRANGEILYWLNSDDLLFPNALKTVGSFFYAYPNVDVVFGDRHIIDCWSKLIMKQRYCFYTEWLFKYGKSIPQECTFWRKDIYWKVGGLNQALNYAIDLDLWCRFAATGTIRHIPFYLGAFRRHDEGKSSTIYSKGRTEALAILTKYYGKYPSEKVKRMFNFTVGWLRRFYRVSYLYALKRWYYTRSLSLTKKS